MRRSGRPTALALIDIDDFKEINDAHGHQHGDTVLSSWPTRDRDACRATDEPARYGGDELAVILAETDLDGARHDRPRASAARSRTPSSRSRTVTPRVTVSVGVSALEPGHGDPAALIEAADVGLYAAKRTGKNRVRSGGWAAARPEGAGGEPLRRATSARRAHVIGEPARGGLLPSAPSWCRSSPAWSWVSCCSLSAVLKVADGTGTQAALATYGIRARRAASCGAR